MARAKPARRLKWGRCSVCSRPRRLTGPGDTCDALCTELAASMVTEAVQRLIRLALRYQLGRKATLAILNRQWTLEGGR